MEKFNRISEDCIHNTEELRKLIIDNPDLPLLIYSGEEASSDWSYTLCGYCHSYVGEFLDCIVPFNETMVYQDREDLEDAIRCHCEDLSELADVSDEEFDEYVSKEMQSYDEYWRKAIIVYVDG